jgi:hypothetical protein
MAILLSFPPDRGEVASLVHEWGRALKSAYVDGAIILTVEVDKPLAETLREFVKRNG